MGAWGPLPWAPGAPPWGGVRAQTTRTSYWHAPLVFALKPMTILTLIFDRFGVDLGPVLGPCWGGSGSFVGPNCSPDRVRIVLSSRKSFVTK